MGIPSRLRDKLWCCNTSLPNAFVWRWISFGVPCISHASLSRSTIKGACLCHFAFACTQVRLWDLQNARDADDVDRATLQVPQPLLAA